MYHAGFQSVCKKKRLLEIVGNHSDGESVIGIVGHRQHLGFIFHGDDRRHRPEGFLMVDIHIGGDVQQDRRIVDPAFVFSAMQQLGTLGHGILYKTIHFADLIVIDQRTDRGLLGTGIALGQSPGLGRQSARHSPAGPGFPGKYLWGP